MGLPTISLDVEGVLFKTSVSTLTSVKGSYFDCLFQNGWRDRLDKHGHLFIDRDSSLFPLILNFLRDGSIPLPRDEYYLERILREARFFKLQGLISDIEASMKRLNCNRIREVPSPPCPPEVRGSVASETVRSLPSPAQSISGKTPPRTAPAIEPPLVPARPKSKGKNLESISLPRNFAHVAHVGWNGGGVIFDERLLDKNNTVQAIIDAANKLDHSPVYNVISGENGADGSHTVEVVLAGALMQTKDPLYTRPQKRSARSRTTAKMTNS